jgi:hypothetical protein
MVPAGILRNARQTCPGGYSILVSPEHAACFLNLKPAGKIRTTIARLLRLQIRKALQTRVLLWDTHIESRCAAQLQGKYRILHEQSAIALLGCKTRMLIPSPYEPPLGYRLLWGPTNSKKQSPCEASSRLVSKEYSRFLQNPKVHYRVHKSLLLVTVLTQINPVHTFWSISQYSPNYEKGFRVIGSGIPTDVSYTCRISHAWQRPGSLRDRPLVCTLFTANQAVLPGIRTPRCPQQSTVGHEHPGLKIPSPYGRAFGLSWVAAYWKRTEGRNKGKKKEWKKYINFPIVCSYLLYSFARNTASRAISSVRQKVRKVVPVLN